MTQWFEQLTALRKILVCGVGLFTVGISSGAVAAGIIGWPDRIAANAEGVRVNAQSIATLRQDVDMMLVAQALDICERRRSQEDDPTAGSLQTCIVETRREIRELQRLAP